MVVVPRAARKPGGPAAALSRAVAPGAPSGAPYMAFLNLNARAPPPLPPAPSLTSGFVRPGAPLAASAEAAQSALCFSRPTRDSTSSANVASFTAVSCGKPRTGSSVCRARTSPSRMYCAPGAPAAVIFRDGARATRLSPSVE